MKKSMQTVNLSKERKNESTSDDLLVIIGSLIRLIPIFFLACAAIELITLFDAQFKAVQRNYDNEQKILAVIETADNAHDSDDNAEEYYDNYLTEFLIGYYTHYLMNN